MLLRLHSVRTMPLSAAVLASRVSAERGHLRPPLIEHVQQCNLSLLTFDDMTPG